LTRDSELQIDSEYSESLNSEESMGESGTSKEDLELIEAWMTPSSDELLAEVSNEEEGDSKEENCHTIFLY